MAHLPLGRGANPESTLNRLYLKYSIPKPSQGRIHGLLLDSKKKQNYYALLNTADVKFARGAVKL